MSICFCWVRAHDIIMMQMQYARPRRSPFYPALKTVKPNDTEWHDNRYATGASGYGNNPAGRNKRSVWEVATAPFNGSQLLADYVGPDGIPYKRSEDCPIHGRCDRHGTRQTGEDGERLSPESLHNPDTENHPASEGDDAPVATPLMSSCTNDAGMSLGRDLQSIVESNSPVADACR